MPFFPLHLRKIVTDIWFNKTRTMLIVLTIAIGVFAVGTTFRSWAILSSNLSESFQAINPANAVLFAHEFYDDVVEAIRNMPNVQEADARHTIGVRVQVKAERWRSLDLVAFADYNDLRVNKIHLEEGAWPPPDGTMLIERSSLGLIEGIEDIDDLSQITSHQVLIEMQSGKQRQLALTGVAHDIARFPSSFSNVVYGYISIDTLESLTGLRGYNELHVVVASEDDAYIQDVVEQISQKMEDSGVSVAGRQIIDPTMHPLNSVLQAILFILIVLGVFALLLSAFQVFNVISTLLTRQVKQIGIMKAIGAGRGNVLFIYLGVVLLFALLALMISIPTAALGARMLSLFMADLLNLDITSFKIPLQIIGLEWVAGFIIPLSVTLIPIINATRLTVREAIASTFKMAAFGHSMVDQLLNQIRGLPVSLLYALRNTFRHKKRLALTLTTLTVASMIFIVVMSIRASLLFTVNDVAAYRQQDIEMAFVKPHRIEKIERAALSIPMVNRVETRTILYGYRVYSDDSKSKQRATIYGVSANTPFIRPTLIEGRWLLPEDQNAIVINVDFLAKEADLKVGDELQIEIGERETSWQVVGIVTGQLIGGGGLMAPLAYTNHSYLTEQTGQIGRASRVLIEIKSVQNGEAVAKALHQQFNSQGMFIDSTELRTEIRQTLEYPFDLILTLMFFMTILFTAAGGLGLMSLMTLSVLERTKEIGTLRAIGGTENIVIGIVMIEGVFIGLLSWLFGSLLAIPISKLFSDMIGIILLKVPLTYTFPIDGIFLWLAIIIMLSALATYIPARSASRISVIDSLVYR